MESQGRLSKANSTRAWLYFLFFSCLPGSLLFFFPEIILVAYEYHWFDSVLCCGCSSSTKNYVVAVELVKTNEDITSCEMVSRLLQWLVERSRWSGPISLSRWRLQSWTSSLRDGGTGDGWEGVLRGHRYVCGKSGMVCSTYPISFIFVRAPNLIRGDVWQSVKMSSVLAPLWCQGRVQNCSESINVGKEARHYGNQWNSSEHQKRGGRRFARVAVCEQ